MVTIIYLFLSLYFFFVITIIEVFICILVVYVFYCFDCILCECYMFNKKNSDTFLTGMHLAQILHRFCSSQPTLLKDQTQILLMTQVNMNASYGTRKTAR